MIGTGTLVDGKYSITRAIGAGGFGTVYEARQVQFDRRVAIKIIGTNVLMEADGAGRFEREAKALDLLKHKNIVGCYGYGIWDGAPYMVMEYVDGIPLDKIISTEGSLDVVRALNIFRQMLEGLAAAHAAGAVHRDLKPSNIMIAHDADGKDLVKIIDFGLVKLMPGYGVPGQKLTETGCAVGSCLYMAPEQALGDQIDERADIYSAGAILYHMLTGKPPFEGDANVAILFQHLNSAPDSIAKYLPTSAPVNALTVLLDNCMAKDRDGRYAKCADAMADVDLILNGAISKVSPLATRQMKALHQPAPTQSKGKAIAALVITAVVTATITLGAVGYFGSLNRKTSASTDPAAQADSIALRKIARLNFDHRWLNLDELEQIERRDNQYHYLASYDRFLLYTAEAKYWARRYHGSGVDGWNVRTKSTAYANGALELLPSVPDTEEAMAAMCLAESYVECNVADKQQKVLEWMASRTNARVRYTGDCLLAAFELQRSQTSNCPSFKSALKLIDSATRMPVGDGHTARLLKAHADYLEGKFDQAHTAYKRIALDDDQVTCLCGLARIALAQGLYDQALQFAHNASLMAMRDNARSIGAELLAAAALKAKGKTKEAEKIINEVDTNRAAFSAEPALLLTIDERLAREAHKAAVPKVVPI